MSTIANDIFPNKVTTSILDVVFIQHIGINEMRISRNVTFFHNTDRSAQANPRFDLAERRVERKTGARSPKGLH